MFDITSWTDSVLVFSFLLLYALVGELIVLWSLLSPMLSFFAFDDGSGEGEATFSFQPNPTSRKPYLYWELIIELC